MKIVLIHYRYLPSLAGVELLMGEQVRLLCKAGHEVTVLTGAGDAQGYGEKVVCLRELSAPSPKPEDEGFFKAAATLERVLTPWCLEADRVIVHNVLSMPFHLVATVVLRQLSDRLPSGRFIHWLHDLAAVNPDYALPRDGTGSLRWPWSLLAEAHPNVTTIAISEWRAEQHLQLTGKPVHAVIPNGIDPAALLPLTPAVRELAEESGLLGSSGRGLVLFQPARLVPRKQIEVGLRVVAALRDSGGWQGSPVRLLITAAPDEHRPEAAAYREALLELRSQLGLEREVLFLHDHFPVAHDDLIALYSLADVLWFPSQQEGFGLPIIEGSLHRLPIFCADLPPMNRFNLPGLGFFDPGGTPEAIAGQFSAFLGRHSAFIEARKTAMERFSWETVTPQFLAVVNDPFTIHLSS